jgi:hypothetical protein
MLVAIMAFQIPVTMIMNGIVRCIQSITLRMFPVFPQLQLALPAIQRTPLAIMNQREETHKFDLAKWLEESFLQFATPKKRVGMDAVVHDVDVNSETSSAKSNTKVGIEDKYRRVSEMWQVQVVTSFVQ